MTSLNQSYEPEDVIADSVFRVGKVISVKGRQIEILVDKSKNSSHLLFRGDLLKNVSVSGYLKITKGFSEIIAKVDGESVIEDTSPSNYKKKTDKQKRILIVSLIGFFDPNGNFKRGVRELPLIDNECFILNPAEFNCIHHFVDDDDSPIRIGRLAMERGQPVDIGIDSLMASHIGIFGNTGSGKSYTLAKIYYQLFKEFKENKGFTDDAHFVLIDFNGEYVNKEPDGTDMTSTSVIVEDEYKDTLRLSTGVGGGDRLALSPDAVNDPSFWTVLLDATEKTQAPFIQRTLESDYWNSKLGDADDLKTIIGDLVYSATKSTDSSFDKHVVISFLNEISICLGDESPQELRNLINDYNANLSFHSVAKTFYYAKSSGGRIWSNNESDEQEWKELTSGRVMAIQLSFLELKDIDLVRFKVVMQYYSDIIRGFANREHIGPLIKRLETRIPDVKKLIKVDDESLLKKPLTVVSLREVNLSMRKVLPMMLCKYLYEHKKKNDPANETYLNIIIDEAHNILSSDSVRESEAWRDYRLETFEEIIKEGRKFGVFLTIASQRPHDISETIISQLHNYFLHRLINNLDIHAVEKAVAYLDKVSFDSLPIQPTGTCVLSGISAQIPVVMDVDRLPIEYEPNSKTMKLSSKWNKKS